MKNSFKIEKFRKNITFNNRFNFPNIYTVDMLLYIIICNIASSIVGADRSGFSGRRRAAQGSAGQRRAAQGSAGAAHH